MPDPAFDRPVVDPVARLGLVVLTDTEFEQWAKDAWPPLADAVLRAYPAG